MRSLDNIAEDLFNKIRGRFPSITIGDQNGKITNDPLTARFFDFDYKDGERNVGKVSISVSEDALAVMYSNDFIKNEDAITQQNWYNFLKELRTFAKKRLLKFDTRDITKSNLDKRDYKFLAQRQGGEMTMSESKLYGTGKISYQDIGTARLNIRHTQHVNPELPTSRTQHIDKIYIESAEGERFMYPYRHLNGARAMARHVAEGGKPYDDFGNHITGLSEELAKLRKFKNYMNRSSVMAESLSEYMDVVVERINGVKNELARIQKQTQYAEAFESFENVVLEDVPEDVAEAWIDQLTIRQFNEELKDIFPYIYRLVSEARKASELGPDDLEESGLQYYTGVKKHGKEYMKKAAQAGRDGASQEELGRLKDKYSKAEKKKTKEEFELEQAFEDAMGQFADGVCEDCGNPSWRTLPEEKQKGVDGKVCWKGYKRMGTKMKGGKRVDNCVKVGEGRMSEIDIDIQTLANRGDEEDLIAALDGEMGPNVADVLQNMMDDLKDELASKGMNDVMRDEDKMIEILWDKIVDEYGGAGKMKSNVEEDEIDPDGRIQAEIEKFLATNPKDGDDLSKFHDKAIMDKNKELDDYLTFLYDYVADQTGAGGTEEAGVYDEMLDLLHQMLADKGWGEGDDDTMDVKINSKGQLSKDDGKPEPKEQKTPISEFILSYFDRETGEFPKGETAVLTMIEKDYGEQYIEPAKQFIERVYQTCEQFRQPEPSPEMERMRELAGLR